MAFFLSNLRKKLLTAIQHVVTLGEGQKKDFTSSGATGEAFRSSAPKRELCPPSEDCAPKKVKSSVPLKCSSRPGTLNILVVTPEFVSKNCFFADFAIKTLFFGSTPEIEKICVFFELKTFFFGFIPEFAEICDENICFLVHTFQFGALNFLCPPKFVNLFLLSQSSYLGARPGLHQN